MPRTVPAPIAASPQSKSPLAAAADDVPLTSATNGTAWDPSQPLDWLVGEGGKVLSRQHIKARGAGSGIELEIKSFTVFSFDGDGLITRAESFLPHEEAQARAAAGLPD
jgi:hypothetical protein